MTLLWSHDSLYQVLWPTGLIVSRIIETQEFYGSRIYTALCSVFYPIPSPSVIRSLASLDSVDIWVTWAREPHCSSNLSLVWEKEGFPGGTVVENLPAMQEARVRSLGWDDSPGGRRGNPLQCSFLENPHGCKSLGGCSPWGHTDSDVTEATQEQQRGWREWEVTRLCPGECGLQAEI